MPRRTIGAHRHPHRCRGRVRPVRPIVERCEKIWTEILNRSLDQLSSWLQIRTNSAGRLIAEMPARSPA
jgi:hypothetical protein